MPPGPTSSVTNPITAVCANGTLYRVVSAELVCLDTNAITSKQGSIIAATMPLYQLAGAGIATIDTIKDSYHSIHVVSGADAIKAVALPGTIMCQAFGISASQLGPNYDWFIPVIVIAGGVANGTYTFSYHANYEYIPSANYTDVILPEVAEPGSFDGTMAHLADMLSPVNSGAGLAAAAGLGAAGITARSVFGALSKAAKSKLNLTSIV